MKNKLFVNGHRGLTGNNCNKYKLPENLTASGSERVKNPVGGTSKNGINFVLNTPNVLTLLRFVAIIPLAVMLYDFPKNRYGCLALFLAIWFTDVLDGFIARHFHLITDFGKMFDPLVDKLFQGTVAVMLTVVGAIPVWVPVFVILRELIMIFSAAFLLKNRNVVVYSDVFGKLATFTYALAMLTVFIFPDVNSLTRSLTFVLPVMCSIIATVNYGIKNKILFRK